MEPLFAGISNLQFYPADFKGIYKGIKGLVRLYLSLIKLKPSHIADIHNVSRTWILRTLFFFSFVPVHYLKKGRKEKRRLTRKKNKVLKQLKPSCDRYASVLSKTGIVVPDKIDSGRRYPGNGEIRQGFKKDGIIRIGFAPFAKHQAKSWPVERVEDVISALSEDPQIKIYLFGGGWRESTCLQAIEQKYSAVESVAGKFGLEKELDIISGLDLLVSMDSANMHLASFAGTPVISIWGATHPFAGFYGWNQSEENIIQTEMDCRPCSVYGNKKCYRGDYACLMNIEASDVLERVKNYIKRIKEGEKKD